MNFADDTAVREQDGSYSAAVRPGWGIQDNANGGYLMAIGARAMAAASRPHPLTVTAHFLSPGKVGPLTISPTVVKQGRNFSSVRASVTGPDRPVIEMLGSFSARGAAEGDVLVNAQPPELPDPEACVRIAPDSSGHPPPLMDRLDMRLHPEDARFYQGWPSGQPRVRGWVRLAQEEPVDAFGLLLVADAFPPSIFNADLPRSWVPTLEMTTHVRAVPQPGWLRCAFSTRFVTGGVLEEDGEVWDASGRLVAQSRQLALLPRA